MPPANKAEQRVLFDRVTAIAERKVPAGTEDAVMVEVRNSLSFLIDPKMRTMMGEGREVELRVMLTEHLFGEDGAASTAERLRTRMSLKSSDTRRAGDGPPRVAGFGVTYG